MGVKKLEMPCTHPGCKAQVWIRTKMEGSLIGDDEEVNTGEPYCSNGHQLDLSLTDEVY